MPPLAAVLLRLSLLASLLLPLAACASSGAAVDGSAVVFRAVLTPIDAGFDQAEKIEHRHELLHLGPAQAFLLASVQAAEDPFAGDQYVLHFELAGAEEKDRFQVWTGALERRRMAWVHRGEVMCAPMVMTALPGAGVLAKGYDGFTREQAERLAAELRGDG